jgi:hypothetical protein
MLEPKSVRLSAVGILAASISLFSAVSADAQAGKYIAQEKELKTLGGGVRGTTKDGRVILEGDFDLAASHQRPGIAWLACAAPDGHVLWSARAPSEPEAASLFPLTTDGDSIWAGGLRMDGIFRFARFNARSLKKEASIQLTFAPPAHSSPCLQLHSDTEENFDLQVSLVQSSGNSIRAALLSREMRLVFDKTYTFTFVKNDKRFAEPGNGYLIRLPDKSGYYLCLRNSISVQGRQAVVIVRLDNDGAIKWANSYPVANSDFEVEPHMGNDGAILLDLSNLPNVKDGPLVKIAPDGSVSWAQTYPRLQGVSVANANFAWTPDRFTEPYLYATGGQLVSTKLFTYLLGLSYSTGEIEKQIKFNSPGAGLYVEKTRDSIYVSLLDMNYAKRGGSQGFLARFDFDLNFRAGCAVRNTEFHWPELCTLPSGKLLVSYSYHEQKTLVAEAVDENVEGTNACGILQKANLSVIKINFQARPIRITTAPLTGITLTDTNGKIEEADFKLFPFALEEQACGGKP